MPFSTFKRLYNTGDAVCFLLIAGYDDIDIVEVENKVKIQLKEIHKVHPDDNRAIGSFNLGSFFTRAKNFANGMSYFYNNRNSYNISWCYWNWKYFINIGKRKTKEIGIRRAIEES